MTRPHHGMHTFEFPVFAGNQALIRVGLEQYLAGNIDGGQKITEVWIFPPQFHTLGQACSDSMVNFRLTDTKIRVIHFQPLWFDIFVSRKLTLESEQACSR